MAYLNETYYTRRFVSDTAMTHVCLNFPAGSYYVSDVYIRQGLRTQQLFFIVAGVVQPDYTLAGYFASTNFTAFEINRNEEFYFSFYVRGDFPIDEFEGLYDDAIDEDVIIGSGELTGGTTVIIDGNEAIVLNPGNPGSGPITAIVGDASGNSLIPYVPGAEGPIVSVSRDFTVTPSLGYWGFIGAATYDNGLVVSYSTGPNTWNSLTNQPDYPADPAFIFLNNCTIEMTIRRKVTPSDSYLFISFGPLYEVLPGISVKWQDNLFDATGVAAENVNVTTASFRLALTLTDGIYTVTSFYNIGSGWIETTEAEYSTTDKADFSVSCQNTSGTPLACSYVVEDITVTEGTTQLTSAEPQAITFVSVGSVLLSSLFSTGSMRSYSGLNQGHIALPSLASGVYLSNNDRVDFSLPVLTGDGSAWFAFGSVTLPFLELGGGDISWGEMTLPVLECSLTGAYAFGSCFLVPLAEGKSFIQGVPVSISDSLKPTILLEGNQEIINIAESLFWGM